MIALRRRTRETLRHERAVVLQELGTPTAAQVRQDIAANRLRADQLRRAARRRGGEPDGAEQQLGLVSTAPVAGGNGSTGSPCNYCGYTGGHSADCPVIS